MVGKCGFHVDIQLFGELFVELCSHLHSIYALLKLLISSILDSEADILEQLDCLSHRLFDSEITVTFNGGVPRTSVYELAF